MVKMNGSCDMSRKLFLPMSTPSSLRWGIIGLGAIAKTFAEALDHTSVGTLVAVASRSLDKARDFGARWPQAVAYGSYQELLDDENVEAVYIATPHPQHAEWVVKAAEAGKHILCEKPITLNAVEAEGVFHVVQRAGVCLMEAFMYRCHPQTLKIAEVVRDGKLGDIRLVEAGFAFDQGPKPEGRHQANELGGGGILDVGCYPMSMARIVAGAAKGQAFADPVEIKGLGHLDEVTGVDTWAAAVLKFPGDILAQIATGVRLNHRNDVRIYGGAGTLTVTSPWFCNGELLFQARGSTEVEKIAYDAPKPLYVYEIEAFAAYVKEGKAPVISWADTLGNMCSLDRWRQELSFLYQIELPTSNWPTVDRRPLRRSATARMAYGELEGVKKPISKLILGTMMRPNLPARSILFDEFVREGGNAFDTAWIYSADGSAERTFGQWVRNRDVRDEVVVIVKGAHTPSCDPVNLERQFEQSLDRLGMVSADIYVMHRDNTEIPVGEFVDVINRRIKTGEINAYGFSNWTLERVDEALEYAGANGLVPPVCISNQLSLARMVKALWVDCLSVGAPEAQEWLAKRQMANLAWSSQARGFFTDRSALHLKEDKLLSESFYAEDNFERKARAYELAAAKGVLPVHIAGSYVLQRSFPSFSLIGPQNLHELHSNLGALDLTLTPAEMAWLNLETEKL